MPSSEAPAQHPARATERGGSTASRRAGYVIAVLVDAALLFVVELWPGWRSLSILTPEASTVVPWVDAALIAGIVVNLLNLIVDRRWLKIVGDLVTTVIGSVAAVVVWAVFPFDFTGIGPGWEIVARIAVVVTIGGSAIGIVVALVGIVRLLVRPSGEQD